MVHSNITLNLDFTLKSHRYGIYALLRKCKARCNSLTFEARLSTFYV